MSPERQRVLEFALELNDMAKRAPDEVTAHFLRKLINGLRIRYAMPEKKKREAILNAIGKSEARTVEEIAEDIGLTEEMVSETLQILKDEQEVYSIKPLVSTNQTRRKFPLEYFYLMPKVSPSQQSVS